MSQATGWVPHAPHRFRNLARRRLWPPGGVPCPWCLRPQVVWPFSPFLNSLLPSVPHGQQTLSQPVPDAGPTGNWLPAGASRVDQDLATQQRWRRWGRHINSLKRNLPPRGWKWGGGSRHRLQSILQCTGSCPSASGAPFERLPD